MSAVARPALGPCRLMRAAQRPAARATCLARSPLLRRPFPSVGPQPHARLVAASARRGRGRGSADDPEVSAGGFQFSKHKGVYYVNYNDAEIEVREDEAWKLALPIVGALVFGAALIGPLVMGIVFTAVAFSAAMTAGALFTSLFLPFFIMAGVGALMFGGLTFGAFATLGATLFLPKLMSLAIGVGGLGLGAMAVGGLLRPAADKAKVSYRDKASKARRGGREEEVLEAEVVEPAVDPEVDRQLREFDDLLKERENQRRRTDRFRQSR